MKTNVRDYWDGRYRTNGFIYGTAPSHLAKWTALNRWFERGQKVLELGGGYGRNGIFFAKNGIEVVSLDISSVATKMGILAADHANLSNIRFLEGDIHSLPTSIRGEKFDGVFSNFCLHLAEWNAVREFVFGYFEYWLNLGGRVILSLLSTKDPDFGKGERIAKNIFELDDGRLQIFFDRSDIRELFGNTRMKIESLKHAWELETIVSVVRNTPFWIVVAKKQGDPDG